MKNHRSNTNNIKADYIASEYETTQVGKQKVKPYQERQKQREKLGHFVRVLINGIPSLVWRKDV